MKQAKGFGVALRKARERRGWTQVELAKRAGLPQNQVSQHETGGCVPRMSSVTAYAEAFGVPAIELVAPVGPAITSDDLAFHADRCESDRLFEAAAVLRRIVREMESAR